MFGAGAVLVGAGFLLIGGVQLLIALFGPELDPVSAASAVALYVLIGLVLIGSGIGSMRRRRWVRPVMLLVSGTWILVGAVASWLVLLLMPEMLLASGIDPAAAVLVRAVLIGAVACGGLLLPAAFFWAYRDPRVQTTCERHDPRPSWTDRCPAEVLTLSGALLASAVLSLPMLARPVIPLFGHLATGWGGRLALAAGIAGCGWLAWSTYRLRAAGWWGTTVFLVLLGASTAWTFARVDPLEVYRQLGSPEELLETLPSIAGVTRTATEIGALVLTAGGVAWMLRIRRHFT